MRARWHKYWLLALWVTACGLNPQPDLPAGRPSDHGNPPNGFAGFTSGAGAGGSVSLPGTGGNLSVDPGNGGGDPNGEIPTAGDSGLNEGGAGGTPDDVGSGGTAAEAGAAGAAEASAAGAN